MISNIYFSIIFLFLILQQQNSSKAKIANPVKPMVREVKIYPS